MVSWEIEEYEPTEAKKTHCCFANAWFLFPLNLNGSLIKYWSAEQTWTGERCVFRETEKNKLFGHNDLTTETIRHDYNSLRATLSSITDYNMQIYKYVCIVRVWLNQTHEIFKLRKMHCFSLL